MKLCLPYKERKVTRMEKKKYLRLAIDHVDEDTFLDTWFGYLAQNKIWYSASDSKKYSLYKLDSTHLYNIKNGIIELFMESTSLPQGAAALVAMIDFLLAKRAKLEYEASTDLPF